MSMDSRSTRSALFKRAEQLKRWELSDTNREPSVINGDSRKIKFSAGCVFLAACAAGDKEEVLYLLNKGADIDTTNVDGLSALHQACIDDNLDMVEFLVEHGADVNKGDNEGWTPLHATASCGFVSIAKYLIEKGANVAAVNYDGELPVDIAESDDMENMLQQQLEERGIDAESARTEEQRVMLEDAKNWLSRGRINEKIHPKTGASSLHVAAAKGYIKVMEFLLEAGSDVDAQDLDGWTPLHAASHWGQKEASRLLIEHFCDMDTKNCVGQTAFDVADSQMVSYLEELRKKQSSLSRDNFINKKKNNNNIQPLEPIESRKTRISDHLKADVREDEVISEVKNKVPDVPQIEVQIQPVPNDQRVDTDVESLSTETSDLESSDVSGESDNEEEEQIERKNIVNKDEPSRTSPLEEVIKQVPNTPAPPASPPKQKPVDDEESGPPSWRKPVSLRIKEEVPRLNLPLRLSERETIKNNQVANLAKAESPQEVVLRRTQSFEADEKRGQVKEEPRVASSSASLASPVATPTAVTTSVVTVSSPTTTTSSGSSPVTSPQHTNQVRSSSTPCTPSSPSKRSPGSIIKSFFKSFVPPVRDEESETQRKAHAKRVRETRRSTQGVTLEEIKSAEQLVKKKQQEAAIAAVAATQPQPQSQPQKEPAADAVFTLPSSLVAKEKKEPEDKSSGATSTTVSATIVTDGKGGVLTVGDRRPSWRLKVNNGSKFMLEDARVTNDQDKIKSPSAADQDKTLLKGPPVTGETTVTLPLRRSRPEDREQDKENDSRTAQATQGVIQRRRRPKRRSTGVVHVDMDEIDPDRNMDSPEAGEGDSNSRINNLESEGEKERSDPPSRVSPAPAPEDSESASENGELDYKKLYEESQCENERLREKLRKAEEDLNRAKLMSEKVPYVPMRNSLSEAEKREKRAMERKLSEMEEELKQLQKLKADNERLRAENRALTRVVSKLTSSQF